MTSVRIQPYENDDHAGVVQLVTQIQQQEFGVPITYEDQPDLQDISGFFRQKHGGEFWVARADDRVVGSIGLLDIGQGNGVLRKMFVAAACRGQGVSQQLIEALEQHAARLGLRHIYLGTGEMLKGAHRFYEKSGYRTLTEAALPPGFPRVHVDTVFYGKSLPQEASHAA